MPSFIRHPKNFWAAIIFLTIGLAAVIIGRDYPMGTAGRMGPAYFPTVLGGLLALIGLAALLRAVLREGEAIEPFAIKNLVIILGAVLLFAFLIRGAGLAPAILVLVVLSGLASSKFRWGPALLLSAGVIGFSLVVFVKLLGLPIAMIGPWFGF